MFLSVQSVYSVSDFMKDCVQEKGKEGFFEEMLETYNYWGELVEQGEVHDEYPQIAVESLLEQAGYSWEEWFSWVDQLVNNLTTSKFYLFFLMTINNKTKTIEEWLSECPTSWNMEYHEDFDKMCYFIRGKNEDEKTFFELFAC